MLPRIRQLLASAREATYLFGGGVALLACFPPFQGFRHPPVPVWPDKVHSVGAATVRQWAETLPPGGDVLDLGCGPGAPISQALADEGLNIYGVDASPSMISAFRARFPHAPAERSAVEDSQFFGRSFDGAQARAIFRMT